MATYTTYTDGRTITAAGGSNAAGSPAVTVLTNEFDAAKRNLAAADIVEVLAVPARTWVSRVYFRVLTADSGQTITIGDGSDTDGYIVGGTAAATTDWGCSTLALTEAAPNTVTGYSGGKFYTAADTIDILVPSGKAYDTLKVQVCAEVTLFG